jgi:phenylalanyl-tRNA synthetase beta chain
MVEGRGAVLDVDLDEIERLQPQPVKYTPSRRYPSSAFDLSVVVGLRELVAGVRKRLCALAGEALESIEFVRLYIGAPLAEGRKSVSFRLTVAARDRTLSSEEVGAIRTHIIEGMRAAGHELRL